jgi:antitoxin (DNA-binding transcriptional repressor) of toxin-antitoxin stability system
MPTFALDEIVAARDAVRGFSGLLERLRNGQSSRYVIFFRNRPQAVLVHIDHYEELISRASGHGDGT